MKTQSRLSSANSARFAASRRKSVSSRNVAHISSTTARKSSICSPFMYLEARRASMRMMSMSSAIVAFTPGRWILMATDSPEVRTAR